MSKPDYMAECSDLCECADCCARHAEAMVQKYIADGEAKVQSDDQLSFGEPVEIWLIMTAHGGFVDRWYSSSDDASFAAIQISHMLDGPVRIVHLVEPRPNAATHSGKAKRTNKEANDGKTGS